MGAGQSRPTLTATGGRAVVHLSALQNRVQRLYRLELEYDVTDFVTSRRELLHAVHPASEADCEEFVLLRQDEHGDMELSVFLDADLLTRLDAADPFTYLHDDNLADFCIAVEGVSHFVHLIWRAVHSGHTTQFELELQAEIDKFLLASQLLYQQQGAQPSHSLHARLFEQVRFHDALAPDARRRYREANHYAAKYCRHLAHAYLSAPTLTAAPTDTLSPIPGMVQELFYFYRLSQPDKVHHINNLGVSASG